MYNYHSFISTILKSKDEINLQALKLFLQNHLLPLSCLLCQQSCSQPIAICSACVKLISPANKHISNDSASKEPWCNIRSLSNYQSPIKELIHKGKFQDNLAVFKALGQVFAQTISQQSFDTELVLIPVPLHQDRLLIRGYNQAHEIALPLAKQLGLSINNHCVIRIENAKTQHFLNKQQRLSNTSDIFQINASVPEKVAVIDDVFTTGATMRSICTCLEKAGAKLIEVWIIARTLKQS